MGGGGEYGCCTCICIVGCWGSICCAVWVWALAFGPIDGTKEVTVSEKKHTINTFNFMHFGSAIITPNCKLYAIYMKYYVNIQERDYINKTPLLFSSIRAFFIFQFELYSYRASESGMVIIQLIISHSSAPPLIPSLLHFWNL